MALCEHAERCGGCPIIALPYPEQLALKRGRVVQSLARYPALELVYTEPVLEAVERTGYRTRAKLIAAPGPRLGLFARGGGHQVVDIPGCQVLAPVLARVAMHLRAKMAEWEAANAPLAPFDPRGAGWLRAVDLRETRDGASVRILVTFVVERERARDLQVLQAAARELLDALPEVAGVAANFHEGDSPQVLGGETVALAGVASAPDRVGASVHLATFGSFVQAHRGQAERLHAIIAEAIGVRSGPRDAAPRRAHVLDLYGGSGAIGLGLATAGARVHLVESFAPAVEQARESAHAQSLDLLAECADVVASLRAMVERDDPDPFDAAVVNPPRRGMSPPSREWLARIGAPVCVYVSCNPETLARDLDHLARLGYAATNLRPVDMIPLTDEVETVAVLRRTRVPPPPVAYEDEELLVVEKSPHEPTMPQGEYASSLLSRTRSLPNADRAVALHRLDVGTSGLVCFVRGPELVAKWERTLAAARAIYLAAVRGVTPSKGAVTRDLREHGKVLPARTRYRRLAMGSGQSILRAVPDQGRTHQVRRHLAAIGHPILGDDRYGHAPTNRYFEEKHGLDRSFLHCVRLEFEHPNTGVHHVVEAPLPGDLRAVLERIGGAETLRFLDHKNALGSGIGSSLPPPAEESDPEPQGEREAPLEVDASCPTLPPPAQR
jgi:23S rRNA (uracil1939-C5)-methyltransferase